MSAHAVDFHSLVNVDADIGIRFGMEAAGLLVNSIEYKPTREKTSAKNFRGVDVVHIFTNPKMVMSIDANITLLSGTLGARHPGAPIHKGYVLNFYADVACGFDPAADGYFIYGEPTLTSPPGNLSTTKFDLEWFSAPTNTVNHVAAPAAP